jgi:RimJ/RimL family protein N-acetyltransferase
MDLRSGLLRGKKVRLTAVTKGDLPTMMVWWSDTDFLRLYDSVPAWPQSVEQLEKRLDDEEQGRTNFTMGIRPLHKEKLLGLIELDGIMWTHGTSSVSIAIGDTGERGRGHGTEAMGLMLDFAFRELNLHRVFLSVFSYNTAAIALYEKLGFTREGSHREHLQRDGQRYDMLLYGILRRECEQRVGEKKQQL